MSLDVRRAGDRFRTDADGRTTAHSFSFGPHYDPANTSFGGLICHNDDRVAPGSGYADHPHRDLEIVTWVLSGALTHRDASGATGVVTPGRVQALSAGSGIVHSETVAPDAGPTRFIQTWVLPATPGGVPSHVQAEADLVPDELTPLASGVETAALVRIGAAASLYCVKLDSRVELPDAAKVHVFVATGSVTLADSTPADSTLADSMLADSTLADSTLAEGDAARLVRAGGLRVTGRAELLVWVF